MRSLFSTAIISFVLMAAEANAQGVVETCVTQQADSIGITTVGDVQTDLTYLQTNEAETSQWRLSAMQLCTNSNGQLTGARAIVVAVPLDNTATTPATVPMNKYGSISGTGISCETLTLDYANDEYVSGMTTYFDTSYTREVSLTTNLGKTLLSGKHSSTMTTESLTFTADAPLVALHGTKSVSYFSSLGGITVSPSCVYGSVIPSPVSAVDATEALSLGAIIGIAVAGAVVLGAAIGVSAWCCYKKNLHETEKTGIETVTYTKTRPMTPPPSDTAKGNKNDAVPHVATDEEDISAREEQQAKG